MKRFTFNLIACTCMLLTLAWPISEPAGALASINVSCADGTTRTCSGSYCQGEDDGTDPSKQGYCYCSGPDGAVSTASCPVRTVKAPTTRPNPN